MSKISAPRRAVDRDCLLRWYREVRGLSNRLTDPLTPEDMVVQIETFASPAKWHLAHTTWFFETFILEQHEPGFKPYDPRFRVLFNSYYHGVGEQHPRPKRGGLTRPGIGEVMAYRDTVDERLAKLLGACSSETFDTIAPLIELGLHHEQQHQELILTDIKLLLHANPVCPGYRDSEIAPRPASKRREIGWLESDGGVIEIGHDGDGFAYDNEGPRHRCFLEPFAFADRLVTNAEYLAFIEDRGYETPRHWLDDGWTAVQARNWRHPMYWRRAEDGGWMEYTLDGLRPLDRAEPVCHVSFFEADAYARWAGARLPTEAEWEHLTAQAPVEGNFAESDLLHPSADKGEGDSPRQIFGDVWEWTRSAHEPYPGYQPPAGAVGEYNGKFMCGTFVLRGGSCVTSRSHIRPTYRNFFEPAARWQFSGIRLARSAS